MDKLTIKLNKEQASEIEAAAKVLRTKPEVLAKFATSYVAERVLKDGECILPLIVLPSKAARLLHRAAAASHYDWTAGELLEWLIASALEDFERGDFSLLETDEAINKSLSAVALRAMDRAKQAEPMVPVLLPASLILPLRAAFDAADLDGGLEGHIAALLESLIDDLRRGDAESVTGAFIFDPAEEKEEADAAMAAAVRAFEKKEVAA